MIEKVSKRFTQYYQVSLVLIMIATLGVILYFWKLGFIDGSKGKDLHQASYILETYDSKNIFKEIKDLIVNENPKLAIEKTKEIEKDLGKVNQLVEVKEFKTLDSDIQKLKTSAANLISFSKVDKVINVFNTKMDKFYAYVKINKWRTLTRMSDRVYSQTNGHINQKKLLSLVKNVNRDFNTMIKVTDNSVLSRKDKSEVISRIENLKIEIGMLKKYADERAFYSQLHQETKVSLKNWYNSVSPEITLQKLQMDQIGRFYVLGLLGILFLVTGVFFTSFVVNKVYFRKARGFIEEEFENYINETLLDEKPLNPELFSENFQAFSERMSGYFSKRMSFGSIFQDALPLSSILLDNNLKVVWANKQFCRDIDISEEEMKKDYMSWDFLNKLTNIGNNDPVMEALKNKVAGIYQIKIKPNSESTAKPFEMFVSPVKYKGNTRVMLFFYNLTNLEDTIQEQARCLLSPIYKSLDLMIERKFQASDELAQEFSISENDNIYEQFIQLNDKYKQIENNLIDQLEFLHSEVENFETQNNLVSSEIGNSLKNSKINITALKTFKEQVIGLSTLTKNLNGAILTGYETLSSNKSTLKDAAKKIDDLREITADVFQGMPRFQSIKEHIRNAKASAYEGKSRLAYELAQLTLLMKRAHDPAAMEKVGRSLTKVNQTFQNFDQLSEDLDKKISSMELILSKTQLLINSGEEKMNTFGSEWEVSEAERTRSLVQSWQKNQLQAGGEVDLIEAEIVESLHQIFKATKGNIQISAGLRERMVENPLNA